MTVQRQVGAMTDCKESAVDLRGKEFRFAARQADGRFILPAAGGPVVGVISEGKDVGLHTSVNTGNQLKVIAGAVMDANTLVQSDATGAAVAQNGAGLPVGRTMHPVGSIGALVTVQIDAT